MVKKLIIPLIVIVFCVALTSTALAHDLPYGWTGEYIQPNDPDVQRIVSDVCTYPLEAHVYDNVKVLYYWVAYNVRYMSDVDRWGEEDYWQLPATTINLGTGDCEDQAILLTSLIRGAGVPRDKVHLVIGKLNWLWGGLVGWHAWVEVKLGTGSLEEASEAIAPYVGDELVVYTNDTVVNAILTEEKLEEIKTLGWGARDGWLPLDTATMIISWPIEIPIPFESWIWFGYYTYWLGLVSAEPVYFYVDPPPSIVLCDQFGNGKTRFSPSDDVYAKGSRYPTSTEVTIYVILDGHSLTPSNAKTVTHKTTEADGTLAVTLLWRHPLDFGKYDIWVDVNQNDVFDDDDVCADLSVGIFGFFVIPEPSALVGTILMFGALATFYFTRKRKLYLK